MMQLVAAGIAGSCENCGSLLSTDSLLRGLRSRRPPRASRVTSPPHAEEVPKSDGPALETGEHERGGARRDGARRDGGDDHAALGALTPGGLSG